MIYLVEKLNENNQPTLGSEGRFIFRKYNSLKSLERYALSWIIKKYPKVWVSVFFTDSNIYGTPNKVIEYNLESGYLKSHQIYPVKSI